MFYFLLTIDELIYNTKDKKNKILDLESLNKDKYAKNIIYILEKDKNQKILINSEYLFDIFKIKDYKNIFDKITFIINDIKYFDYDFFIWYINNNNIKKELFGNFIIKNINDVLKNFILNIGNENFKNIIKNKDKINFDKYEINVYKDIKYIDAELYYDSNIEKYAKKYITDKINLALNCINKNIELDCYIVKNINFHKVNIIIDFNKKHKKLELSLTKYSNLINYLKNSKIKKEKYFIAKRRIYFYYEIISLNKEKLKNLDFLSKYNLLDLEHEKLFELILKENIYEELKMYFDNKFINIKKYLLYQLLY